MDAMTRSTALNTLLFWGMMILGTAALAPCLVLPPWLEYQAQLDRRRAAERRAAAMEQRLASVQKSIEHHRTDPAYILRLAEQEFGDSIDLPDVETILIDPSPEADSNVDTGRLIADEDVLPEDELLPELSAFLEHVLRRYPHTRLFVTDATRRPLMVMGGVLIAAAVLLLGLARGKPTDEATGGADAGAAEETQSPS